jgi:alkanesulfonate monooxygenase SsuD/methylene tetrahydromethanopterin reductase-like flavin-dependent oxidoreductase (luciferase family)
MIAMPAHVQHVSELAWSDEAHVVDGARRLLLQNDRRGRDAVVFGQCPHHFCFAKRIDEARREHELRRISRLGGGESEVKVARGIVRLHGEALLEGSDRLVVKPTIEGSFDYDGAFLELRNIAGDPKPYGGTEPVLMNAGSSGAGRAFAARSHVSLCVRASWVRTRMLAASSANP